MRNFRQPNIYSITGTEKDNCMTSLPYRNVQCLTDNAGQICGTLPNFPGILTLRELFDEMVDNFYDRPLFGAANEISEEVEWISYGDFSQLVKKIVASLIKLGINSDSIVSIYIENSVWFVLTLWSLQYLGAIILPVDISYSMSVKYKIMTTFKSTAVVCSAETFQEVFDMFIKEDAKTIKNIFVSTDKDGFEKLQEENGSELGHVGNIPIHSFSSFIESRVASLDDLPQIYATTNCAINLGSGRGNALNGAILTHSNLIAAAAGLVSTGHDFSDDVYMSTISMTKPVERSMQLIVMASGGCIGFSRNSDIINSLKIIRPTVAAFTKETMQDLAESLVKGAWSSSIFKRIFLDFGFSVTAQCIEAGRETPWFLQSLLLDPIRAVVGGRLSLVIGSCDRAEPRVIHVVRTMLNVDMVQVYGTVETGGVISCTRIDDQSVTSVGAPTVACEVKLRDFLEGNMNVSQNEPGEVLVRGPNVFPGYARNRPLTERRLLDGGWFATGDLGRIHPNGTLEITDTIAEWRSRKARQ